MSAREELLAELKALHEIALFDEQNFLDTKSIEDADEPYVFLTLFIKSSIIKKEIYVSITPDKLQILINALAAWRT